MNKIVFVGLLSLITINFLSADEYISDAYLEEISAQEEFVSEPVTTSASDASLDALPIATTLEEEPIANREIIIEETLPIAKTMEEEITEEEAIENQEIITESLPIATIIEEEPIENREIIGDVLPIVKSIEEEETNSIKETLLVEENSTVVTKKISSVKKKSPSSPYLKALKKARDEHKIVMLFIRATHCKYCDKMEKETLSDSSVKYELEKNFVMVSYNRDIEVLPLGLRIEGTPTFVFVNTNEDVLNIYPGLKSPLGFKGVLAEILSM